MESLLDWTIDNMGKTLMILILLCFIVVAVCVNKEIEEEKRMIAKCSPNPQQFECQLYLSKVGKKRSSNFGTGMAVGMGTGMVVGRGIK